MKRARPLLLLLALAAAGAFAYASLRPAAIVLTGIVTTNDVVVSPQVAGQLGELLVSEGDVVKKGQLLATLTPDELKADTAYYVQNVAGLSSQVRESEAALRFEQSQTEHQTAQAEATLAATEAQVQAAVADLGAAGATYARTQDLARQRIASAQDLDQAKAVSNAAQAKLDALKKQVEAQRAAVALARASADQVAVRRSQVQVTQHQEAAAAAQRTKADVRLAYTEIHAPIDGFVDVRAVRAGEYVNPGQPVLTLVNPDDLWVRADIEETYVDHVRIGDTLNVRLPSGAERPGTVFYRGADASYATQRDVSRTKRDIKTFEIRLRLDNRDRALALGMTAYVALPVR
ncbi:MAG TPA: efflux RND transporter periplasmic adaptor subunit [Vicinamibacteria bacterium]|nr:efflux RND transporter periplasmic adaptor subunit [Vicinamibacteria bacterium]